MGQPDLSEFERLSNPKKKVCGTGKALEQLGETEAAQLQAALDQPKEIITPAAIAAWLEARGISTNWQNVTSHRHGSCGCGHE